MFDPISPLDGRYADLDVARYLGEEAFHRTKCEVEKAIAGALAERGICPQAQADAIRQACRQVTATEVATEELKTRHDVKALVNCIRAKLDDDAKRFVHLGATSYDVVSTANSMMFRNAIRTVLIPRLTRLVGTLADLAIREKDTVQIGRTHGQHAVPITFGFAIAGYVSRLGDCILHLDHLTCELLGKYAGPVGAHNAQALMTDDPVALEELVVGKWLDLLPAEISTQIVPPEPMVRLMNEVVTVAGVMADLANDMRQLQRTEIAEVGEAFDKATQVGSSAMPQKQNPITFENAVSCWKIAFGRMATVHADQVSEHQRDLTNSASSRQYGEIVGYACRMAKTLGEAMGKVSVNRERMLQNLRLTGDLILSEAFATILTLHGHPDAHEAMRQMTLRAQQLGTSLFRLAKDDPDLSIYIAQLTEQEWSDLREPAAYVGIAAEKTECVCLAWRARLKNI